MTTPITLVSHVLCPYVQGQAIFESAVICEYLDETASPRLHPHDPLARESALSRRMRAGAARQSAAIQAGRVRDSAERRPRSDTGRRGSRLSIGQADIPHAATRSRN